jgi:hypothetical protein
MSIKPRYWLLVTNTNAINRVTLSVPGKKSIPLAFPLEGGGLGGGEIAVSFKMIIFLKISITFVLVAGCLFLDAG